MSDVKLFVGNLPHDTSDAELLATFAPFDNLVSVCMLGNGKSRSGNACAFAVYSCMESAAKAIKALDGSRQLRPSVANPPIQVRYARNSAHGDSSPTSLSLPSLSKKRTFSETFTASTDASTPLGSEGYVKFFVGCLPVNTTKAQLEEMFRSHNFTVRPDEGVHLMPGRGASGQACAFVHVHEKLASEVVETLNGKVSMGGCVINVRLANSQERRKKFGSFTFEQQPSQYPVFGGYGEFDTSGRYASMFFHPFYVGGSSYGRPAKPEAATGGYHIISN